VISEDKVSNHFLYMLILIWIILV